MPFTLSVRSIMPELLIFISLMICPAEFNNSTNKISLVNEEIVKIPSEGFG